MSQVLGDGPNRNLEPYLQSSVAGNTATISWTQGPKTGELYDRVELAGHDFSTVPSVEDLEKQIVERFIEHRAENIDPDSYESDARRRVGLAIGEAIATLYFAYYGKPPPRKQRH